MTQTPDLTQLSADQLRQLAAELMTHLDQKDRVLRHTQAVNEKLTHELALLKRHRFAKRGEAFNGAQGQLLDELIDADIAAIEAELAAVRPEPIPQNRNTRRSVRPCRRSCRVP